MRLVKLVRNWIVAVGVIGLCGVIWCGCLLLSIPVYGFIIIAVLILRIRQHLLPRVPFDVPLTDVSGNHLFTVTPAVQIGAADFNQGRKSLAYKTATSHFKIQWHVLSALIFLKAREEHIVMMRLQHAEKSGDKLGVIRQCFALRWIYEGGGAFKNERLALGTFVYSLATGIGDPTCIASACWLLGNAMETGEEYDAATKLYREGIAVATTASSVEWLYRMAHDLQRLESSDHDRATVSDAFERGSALPHIQRRAFNLLPNDVVYWFNKIWP